jgi:hypothetical protein
MASTHKHTEARLEDAIIDHLTAQGGYVFVDYREGAAKDRYDKARALDPALVLGFIQQTQPRFWQGLEVILTDEGIKKITKETMVFPRYHQLDSVRRIVAHTRQHGPGRNCLVQPRRVPENPTPSRGWRTGSRLCTTMRTKRLASGAGGMLNGRRHETPPLFTGFGPLGGL